MASTHDPGSVPAPGRATIADWLAIPEERRAELIDGRIVYYAMPGPRHGRIQGNVFSALGPRFDRRGGGGDDRPGGWWFSLGVDMEIGGLGCRPDVIGWRRDRFPQLPSPDPRGVVVDVPDWICEVLSASTANVDTGRKREAYHRAGVTHYWLADPERRSLTVLRRIEEGYVIAAVATPGERVRAEPFGGVEIDLDEVFTDEDEDKAAPTGG
ncbi:MAG: Uma2 family endonuclease [Deltaproteobacteria bacterium]|nr:Uma2 family endonuclease [Myxococcales bacterium]MDP3220474.1 Uma2 family endonuclease [Deltaproteobacteria bacterium]